MSGTKLAAGRDSLGAAQKRPDKSVQKSKGVAFKVVLDCAVELEQHFCGRVIGRTKAGSA